MSKRRLGLAALILLVAVLAVAALNQFSNPAESEQQVCYNPHPVYTEYHR